MDENKTLKGEASADAKNEATVAAVQAREVMIAEKESAYALRSLAWSFIRIGDLLERFLDMMDE